MLLAVSPVEAAGDGVRMKPDKAGRVSAIHEQVGFRKPVQVKQPIESLVLNKPRVGSGLYARSWVKQPVFVKQRIELPAITDAYRWTEARGLAAFPQREISTRPPHKIAQPGSATSYRLGPSRRSTEPGVFHRGYYTRNFRQRQPERVY